MQNYKMRKHCIQPDDSSISDSFSGLKTWIEDSLDIFRDELMRVLDPLFIHIYLDLIAARKQEEAKKFFADFNQEFGQNNSARRHELSIIGSISDPIHLRDNNIASSYRSNKYHISMGQYAFDLLITYLEENKLIQILKIISHYFDIKVLPGSRKHAGDDDENAGITGINNVQDSETAQDIIDVDLATQFITKEAEEAVLSNDKYKHDSVEQFVMQLKKNKEARKSINPNPSYINSEIEKLKDLCKRVNVNKNNLPSICCFTVHNSADKLCCAEISEDCQMIALGYQDSVIEIHSFSGELRKLKSSSELGKSDSELLKGSSDFNKQEDLSKSAKRKKDEKDIDFNNQEEEKTNADKKLKKEKKEADLIFENIGNSTKLIGHSGPVYGVKFFKGNKMLVSCSQDCTIRLWSLELFSCIAIYKAHVFPIWTVDVSSDNFYFASGGADRQACIWSIASNKPERLFVTSLSDVTVVKFHPNGNYLFVGSSDSKIRMHSVQDGGLVRLFNGHNEGITCLEVSYCGKYLLSGSKDKNVFLWDINTGKSINKFVGHEKVVYSVSFCWFGSVVASCGADQTLRLWDRSDAKSACLGVYQTKNTPLINVRFGYRNIISTVGPYSI